MGVIGKRFLCNYPGSTSSQTSNHTVQFFLQSAAPSHNSVKIHSQISRNAARGWNERIVNKDKQTRLIASFLSLFPWSGDRSRLYANCPPHFYTCLTQCEVYLSLSQVDSVAGALLDQFPAFTQRFVNTLPHGISGYSVIMHYMNDSDTETTSGGSRMHFTLSL